MLLGVSAAYAQGRTVTLEVGETQAISVGSSKGLFCDDTSVVKASIKNKNAETNEVSFTGLKVGSTMCRAGSDKEANAKVFTVVVTPAS